MKRRLLGQGIGSAVMAVAIVVSLTSCTGTTDSASNDPVKLGLLAPLSGAYEVPGNDMRDAFNLYLDLNDDKLGGRNVDVSIADEGDTPATSVPSAEKLIKKDVDAVVGGASAENYVAVMPKFTKKKIPLIGIGTTPDVEKYDLDTKYLWNCNLLPQQAGVSMAPYVHDEVDGPVYAIGPDYVDGRSVVKSFTKPFTKLGGELANPNGEPTFTTWPVEKDWDKYINEIIQSNPSAIFAFMIGPSAIQFVKSWAASEEAHKIPLYGATLTESPALEAEGKAALGIKNAMHYSSDIDNAANRRFVSAWSNIHPETTTNMFSLAGWDAAMVLDQAIASIPDNEEVTSTAINDAVSQLGNIDSPRGNWHFSDKTHTPVQKWYLREVAMDGPRLANVVIDELDTLEEAPGSK